jgi:hypothetical protein
MKKIFLFSLFIICISTLTAQDGFHQHDGFALSMSLGPVFGTVTDDFGTNHMELSGTGALFDFKIGGAIKENLILHATILSSLVPGPTFIKAEDTIVVAPDNVFLGEAMLGAGLTWYFMPENFFLSGSVGLGNFSILNSITNNHVSTQRGFSMQLKFGKEWWVSKNWALGVGVTYGKTHLTNEPGDGIIEKMDSNRFGILFNTTFN